MNENMSKNQHIISMCIAFFSCTNIINQDMVCDWKMKDALSRVFCCTCYDNESICNVWCNYIRPLRGFVSHDHILTVLISFQRRTLYENIKKIPKFKRWNIWFVSLPNKSLKLKKYILKFKADLIVKLLTIQPYLNYLKIDKKNDKSGCFFSII